MIAPSFLSLQANERTRVLDFDKQEHKIAPDNFDWLLRFNVRCLLICLLLARCRTNASKLDDKLKIGRKRFFCAPHFFGSAKRKKTQCASINKTRCD